MEEINNLADLTPGCLMFGPIGGAVGLGVGLGQLTLGEAFRVGRLSIRHVGIVVEGSIHKPGTPEAPAMHQGRIYSTGVITAPRLVQAMPSGAEEIEMTEAEHWTDRHAYVRLSEDYPGQGQDAAAIARLMVAEGVSYSFASYAALALWRWGVKTPRLEKWIGRRREPIHFMAGAGGEIQLPREAICSVLADQAWTLAGKRDLVRGTKPQVVTPGMLATQLWRRPGVVWGGKGLL